MEFEYNYNNHRYKIVNPGKIVRINDIYYQNQLEDINNDFSMKFTKRKPIFNKYGLTEQEYFNLIVYGDKEFIPRCKIHNKPLIFNGLNYGYSEYCGKECAEYGRRLKRSIHLKNLYKIGKNPIYTKEHRCKADYSRFISKGLNGIGSLYIAIPTYIENSIKIGISRDINRRSTAFNRVDYSRIEELYSGPIDKVASIEYKVKMNFIDKSLDTYTEVFDKSLESEIKEFIKNLL